MADRHAKRESSKKRPEAPPRRRRVWPAVLATGLAVALLVGNTNGLFVALHAAFSEGDTLQRIFSILENATGDPQTVADYEQLANIAISQERYGDAAAYIEDALALESTDEAVRAALYTKLGSVYALALDYDAAREALTHALTLRPNDAQALILRAQIGIERGEYTQAVADLEGYLATEDQDASIWTVMAQLYEAIGEYEKARESYEKAYALDETAILNVLNSARSDYLLGDYASAVRGYDAYLAVAGDEDGSVHFLRGVAYMQQMEYDSAIADLEAALALGYAEQALTLEQLSVCYLALEDYEAVLRVGAQAMAAPQGAVTFEALYQRMGVAAMTLERYEEAVGYLDQSIALAPGLEGTWYYRGVCHLALEAYAEAIGDFTESINLGFLPQFCHYNRGVCYVQLGQYENALDDMEQTLLAQEPDETLVAAAKDVLWQIAQYLMASQTGENAPPTADSALEITGEAAPSGDDAPEDEDTP